MLARHDLAHAGLPSGAGERRSDADEEGEQQEDRWRDQTQAAQEGEPCRRQDGPELSQEQDPAPIPEIGHGAGQKREEQDGRLGRGLHQGHQVGSAGERGHQPGGTHALDHRAYGTDQVGQPQRTEHARLKRREDPTAWQGLLVLRGCHASDLSSFQMIDGCLSHATVRLDGSGDTAAWRIGPGRGYMLADTWCSQ